MHVMSQNDGSRKPCFLGKIHQILHGVRPKLFRHMPPRHEPDTLLVKRRAAATRYSGEGTRVDESAGRKSNPHLQSAH